MEIIIYIFFYFILFNFIIIKYIFSIIKKKAIPVNTTF